MVGGKRRLGVFFLFLAPLFGAQDPVQWTLAFDSKTAAPGAKISGRLTGAIEPGWHLYSLSTPKGGPNPTTVAIAGDAVARFQVYQPRPERKFDPNFQLDTETYAGRVEFVVVVELKRDAAPGPAQFTAQTRYQCCNEKICLPPKRKAAAAVVAIDPAAKAQAVSIPSGYTEFIRPVAASAPAAAPLNAPAAPKPPATDFALFLLAAFGAGLAAIFTPCVFPMIPFTVSYFINRQSGSRKDGVAQALVFCLGIVVLFTGLGLAAKAVAGPFGVVQLGSSPWVNGFIAAVFIVFGLSLLGAYELTLPSGLLTRMNQASNRGGYLGTLLMGLTFTLTSFACIGPIVGPLLVASVQTSGLQPVFGMVAFSSGLAAPFFALALFPSFLQRLPKSGGWLMRVKVVLGFVVLAISIKYLSAVDQVLQRGLISRETFIAAWVVLFALAGLYLLGFLRLEGVQANEPLGVGRMLIAAAFLAFSLSLLPGLFGPALGELEGYIPVPARTAAVSPGAAGAGGAVWMKNQYREALAQARRENKLVFINFTGYACTNCHWMKANMFTRPEIAGLLKDFVLVDLYTDGSDEVSERNQKLEESRFATVAIPFYAIVDASERVVATFPGLTKNSAEFAAFIKTGTAGVPAANAL